MVPAIAEAMQVPLIRQEITGTSKNPDILDYAEAKEKGKSSPNPDEIDDLKSLLEKCQKQFPDVNSVSCGAILSDYQRNRVEHVCRELGLTVLAPLWQWAEGK